MTVRLHLDAHVGIFILGELFPQRFQALVALFRKYGDRYNMDWMLMAAQGYQESRLDHSARSHVGAIVVMQVMPATGKELKVGDITLLLKKSDFKKNRYTIEVVADDKRFDANVG